VKIKKNVVRSAALLGLTLLLVGCGSTPPPTIVELTFVAAPDINPNAGGRPQPIVVRYYQLAATSAFESADYFQLHDKDAALLGASLLDRQELPLTPGASQKISITAKPGITAIGIAAGYRDIDRAQWRADAPVAAGKTTNLKVEVSKLSVSVAPDGK
jgi:type VI secretion system protein VasD